MGSHDGRDKDRGPEPFEQEIGQGFEDCVSDEKDGQRCIELARGHGDVVGEVRNLCVADIGPVQKADEVE